MCVLLFPGVEGLLGDAELPTNIPDGGATLGLPEGIHDLFFGKFRPLHRSTPFVEDRRSCHLTLVLECRRFPGGRHLAYRIGNFIAFALNTSTCIDEIRGYRFERNGLKRPQPIDLFFKDQFQNHKTPINHWHIRFRYQDIKPALSTTLIRWLRYYEIARSALDVYFIYKSGGYPFINTQFLSLCQALEGLHKTTCESTAMPKERFDTLKKILLENCPDKESEEWLARRLYNDPSLKERLTETLLPFKDLFGSDQLCKQLVRKTVTLRNNMTHNNSTDRPQNASQILLLVKNLELLFQLRLLQIIGFDVRQINAITSNTISKELRHIN